MLNNKIFAKLYFGVLVIVILSNEINLVPVLNQKEINPNKFYCSVFGSIQTRFLMDKADITL